MNEAFLVSGGKLEEPGVVVPCKLMVQVVLFPLSKTTTLVAAMTSSHQSPH